MSRMGYQVAMEYDLRGRKTRMADPDMGVWSYGYNGAGELITQTDPNAAAATNVFDGLGRLTQRSEQRSGTTFASAWTFDDTASCSTSGLVRTGRLCQASVTGGATETSKYDDYGRDYRRTSTIVDPSGISRVFESYTAFDFQNRPLVTAYPQVAPQVPPYSVRRTYNSSGYVSQVLEDGTNYVHWQATARYSDGQPYQSQIGGISVTRGYDNLGRISSIVSSSLQNANYGFDYVGNLISRGDARGDGVAYSETFVYDTLNRLTTETCTNGAVCGSSRTVGYDDFGSITSKPGVAGITPIAGTHRVQTAGGRTYQYDAAGNVLSDGITTISWTPFNLPDYIQAGSNRLDFRYDTRHARTAELSSSGLLTLYVGNQFYEYRLQGGVVTAEAYIASPDGVVGVVTLAADGSNDRRHWYTDHLGSVAVERDAVTQQVTYLGYDEWGQRRAGFNPASVATARGFTGHEHLDAFTLVHMNGRIYDPVLGRFVSSDPFIQNPLGPHNFNRYAYVVNSPLSFTDPSGFSRWTNFRDRVLKPVVAVIVAYYTGGAASSLFLDSAAASAESAAIAAGAGGDIYSAASISMTSIGSSGITYGTAASAIGGAAGGFAAGGIMGGNVESAVYGALSGGITGSFSGWTTTEWTITNPEHLTLEMVKARETQWDQVGLKTLAQSTARGLLYSATGRGFRAGFISALLPALSTEVYQTLVPQAWGIKPFGPGGEGWAKGDLEGIVHRDGNNFGRWIDGAVDQQGAIAEGSTLSRFMDRYVFGMDATSKFHDVLAVIGRTSICESDPCFSTMLPAAALSWSALSGYYRY